MELGKTIVEVIMKNMSNRNMTSVIDAILNVASILCLRLSAMMSELFCRLVEQIHKFHSLRFQLIHHPVYT